MNRRRLLAALAPAAALALAALSGLAILNDWGHKRDLETRRPLYDTEKTLDICSRPPDAWDRGAETCHVKDEASRQRRWCRPDSGDDARFDSTAILPGGPTGRFPKATTVDDGGWHYDWRIGLYESSWAGWRLPGFLYPVSTVARCSPPGAVSPPKTGSPQKAPEVRQALEGERDGKPAGRIVFVETRYVPDGRDELNAVLILLLVGGVSYGSALWARRRQVAHTRHDLRNMMQTWTNQLHIHLGKVGDGSLRERMEELVKGVSDMLLAVDGHGSYAKPPERLRLLHLLDALVDGAQDGETEITLECPHGVVIECWEVPLRRALENLIRNAAQAARGEGRGSVRVRVDDDRADAARIVVENGGDGFPPGILRRFSNRRSLRAGGGIGLTVVREVVSRHGGRIALRNEPTPDGPVARAEMLLPYRQETRAERWRSVMRRRMPRPPASG